MPGAKMALVYYISRTPFAKAKKFQSYDEHFVVATIYKIPDSFKHLIQNKMHTVQKLKGHITVTSPSYSSNLLIMPQIPTSIYNTSQFRSKPVALQSPYYNTSLPVETQLAHQNKVLNPHLHMSIASQIPPQYLKTAIGTKKSTIEDFRFHKQICCNCAA